MEPDLWVLYRLMFRSRLFEEAVHSLWDEGLISGEMHLGMGEEAIAAGIVGQLRDGDAMALDHRGTPPLLMRGVAPRDLLAEFLGQPDGLCAGQGGHMHLFSPEHLAASSGIVGASGPAAAGFALAAQVLRPHSLAVAFFGEGATNQGMLLEAMNLVVAWRLPALFVCKDNGWSITTPSPSVTGGSLVERARGFGMPAAEVDGSDVEAVWRAAGEAMERARAGDGPTFLHACCIHLEGHLLGDQLLRAGRHPVQGITLIVGPLLRAIGRAKGGPWTERAKSLRTLLVRPGQVGRDESAVEKDPVTRARRKLLTDRARLEALEDEVEHELGREIEGVLAGQAREDE
jgi:TPP-dependent pyruvate/acetoin dehydrogenase alpha subunit